MYENYKIGQLVFEDSSFHNIHKNCRKRSIGIVIDKTHYSLYKLYMINDTKSINWHIDNFKDANV